jgi:uncharacterized protein (DUF1697 family)
MSRYIAFLRAINVGGHTVKMDQLRRLFEELDFTRVETFIASGNVIFDSNATNLASLERKIAKHLHKELGYEAATFIRTPIELAAIAVYQPFPKAASEAAAAFNIAFLVEPPSDAAVQKLMALKTDIDDFRVYGREVYWLCRMKQSDSKFSNVVLEKTLGQSSTLRGAKTLVKLVAQYGAHSDDDR